MSIKNKLVFKIVFVNIENLFVNFIKKLIPLVFCFENLLVVFYFSFFIFSLILETSFL